MSEVTFKNTFDLILNSIFLNKSLQIFKNNLTKAFFASHLRIFIEKVPSHIGQLNVSAQKLTTVDPS